MQAVIIYVLLEIMNYYKASTIHIQQQQLAIIAMLILLFVSVLWFALIISKIDLVSWVDSLYFTLKTTNFCLNFTVKFSKKPSDTKFKDKCTTLPFNFKVHVAFYFSTTLIL